jgi:iron-sulfur cluster assembly accessory protein
LTSGARLLVSSQMIAAEIATQEPVVTVTQAAAEQIRSMQSSQPENAGKPLRVYVEGGGCSGLQYGMVFDERREGDQASEWFGVPVVIDEASADYLVGSIIDFSDALTGGGFKITNPKAKSSCGCGKSFEA